MIGHALPVKDDPVAETISRVLPMMGNPKKLFWCGALGAGLSAKISNNYISCSVLLVVAEAMAIGVGLGVDPKVLQEVIHNSTGQTFMGDNVCPVPGVVSHVPSSNGWKLGFKTQMFTKDLGLGVEATAQVGIKPTMVRAALDVHKEASGNPLCVVSPVTYSGVIMSDERYTGPGRVIGVSASHWRHIGPRREVGLMDWCWGQRHRIHAPHQPIPNMEGGLTHIPKTFSLVESYPTTGTGT